MPVPVNQEGYNVDFGVIEQTTPMGNVVAKLKERHINSTPVPYMSGEKLGSNEQSRVGNPQEYNSYDNLDENEATYYERAKTFMGEHATGLLDYDGDGAITANDVIAPMKDIRDSAYDKVNTAKEAVKDTVSDVGASVVQKSGVVDVVETRTNEALVVLKEKTDLALLKAEEVRVDVNTQIQGVGQNLMFLVGGLGVAYLLLSKSD